MAGKKPTRISKRSNYFYVSLALLCVSTSGLLVSVLRPETVESNQLSTNVRVAADEDTVSLPTPDRAIAKGESLTGVAFTKTPWPKSRLTTNYIDQLSRFQNAVARVSLPAQLPVPVSAVSVGALESNAVVEGIPERMRAITVRVDSESAVEGWARSGNFVDVIVLRQAQEKNLGIEAKVVAENVKILSAGRSTEPLSGQSSAPTAPSTITLLTSQEDALKIKTAVSIGKLAFALRGSGDNAPVVAREMTQRKLLEEGRTVIPEKENYQGYATGPDGRTYVLGRDSRWTRFASGITEQNLSQRAKMKEPDKADSGAL